METAKILLIITSVGVTYGHGSGVTVIGYDFMYVCSKHGPIIANTMGREYTSSINHGDITINGIIMKV